MTEERLRKRIAELESELDEARAKAALYDKIVADASDCLVGAVLGIKHEPTDLESQTGCFIFYELRQMRHIALTWAGMRILRSGKINHPDY